MGKYKNVDDMLFETGTVTTDGTGSATITSSCLRPDEFPCVVASSFGPGGLSNVSATNITLSGGSWQIEIITSSPNTVVYYHVLKATNIIEDYIITQDLFNIITQNDEPIITQ